MSVAGRSGSKRSRKTANLAEEDAVDNTPKDRWSKLKNDELREECSRRGIPSKGIKREMVKRLEDWEAQQTTSLNRPSKAAGSNDATTKLNTTESPKPKRSKKEASPDEVVEGPSAAELVTHRFRNADGEIRLRAFVAAPDKKYLDKLKRIKKERMFMLDRQRSYGADGFPCEKFDIAGSTGNIYQTTIGRSPQCVCMDARIRGQKCKHINYALIVILKAPAHLCYQLAFLSDELEMIFANAPQTQAPAIKHEEHAEDYNGQRKPIEGECPICVFDMLPEEELVWCKVACGQNFHKECFEQWKASKNGGKVTCVYCRSEWQEDRVPEPAPGSLASLKSTAPKVGHYQNIGDHAMYQDQQETTE